MLHFATPNPQTPPQLNSETDFVARNVIFQGLASRLAAAALTALPAGEGPRVVSVMGEGEAEALAAGALLAKTTSDAGIPWSDEALGVAAKVRRMT